MFTIGKKYGVSVEDLKRWNNLDSDTIQVGQKLLLENIELNAVTTPVLAMTYSRQDLDELAKIIYAEADGEPFDGLVAVGSVVLNRVKDPDFPNTIHDVIFQPHQFSPVLSGRIYQITPDDTAYKAAEDALSGDDPVNGALFFFNPDKSSSTFFSEKDFVKTIGHHRFYR